jgi:hypothetical protein
MNWNLLAWTRSANPKPEEQPSVPEQSAAPLIAAVSDTVTVEAIPSNTVATEAAPNATVTAEAADIGASTFRAPLSEATGEDYEAWAYHLAHRNPLARRPGTTIKDEYEQFMAARIRSRLLTAAKTIQSEAHTACSPGSPQIALVIELVTPPDQRPPAQALTPTLLLTNPQAMQAAAAPAGPA